MYKRVLVAASALAIAAASAAALLQHRRIQRERREFAERYTKQLRAAREAHEHANPGRSTSQLSAEGTETGVEEEAASVKVIYGSESGNAEALAKGFVMSLRDCGVPATLVDPSRWAYLETYLYHNKANVPLFQPLKPTRAQHSQGKAAAPRPLVYIFIVATAGEGEAAGNFMTLFQEMQLAVRKATAPANGAAPPAELPFKDIYYAVFGLGDSSYKYYCRSATDTNTLLKKGGGTNLHRVGFGDARTGLQEDVFDEWQEKVMAALHEKCGFALTSGSVAPPKPEYIFRYLRPEGDGVNPAETGGAAPEAVLPFPQPPALLEPSQLNPVRIKLLSKTQLALARESDGSSVFRFCFETAGTYISFQAGDHLGIFPANPPEVVARCAAALGISAADLATPVQLCEPVPSRGLLRDVLPARVPLSIVLARYVDLCGRPKKAALRVLAKYCTDPAEQAQFFNLIRLPADDEAAGKKDAAAANGNGLQNSHQHHHHHEFPKVTKLRTIVDYLERFPSCCGIPVGHFLEVMPRIQPRYYSIASDRMSHGTQIEILVRVLTDGLASQYLGRTVHEGDSVFAYVRLSTFHLPQRIGERRPLLLIGPGTGAAAMVGLCYRKEAMMRKQPAAEYGPTMFLFGAQHRSREYFVEEEVMRWCMAPQEMAQWDREHPDAHSNVAARRGKEQPPIVLPASVITHHESAFSRDQEDKVYVTTLIDRYKDQIYEMLTSTCGGGCLVYLSGDASFMAKDVDRALSALLQEKGPMTRVASLEFLRRMEADHRYLKDVY